MKKAKIWLLILSMLAAMLPMTMAEAESGWLNLEAEDANYADVYNLRTDTKSSGEKYIEVSGSSYTSDTPANIEWEFSINANGEYDIWALMTAFKDRT